jgi:molybdate transport repressor ModE-like protein
MRNVQLESVNPLRLKLLVEVQRRGSIAAAADACAIGQPSASMHLRTLEAATGELLLHRNGRGSGVTDAGRIVAGHAARVLRTLELMQRDLQALNSGEQGSLSIAASGVPSSVLLPVALRGFAARHPGIALSVRTLPSEAVASLVARDEVDIGVAGEARASDRVLRETIFEDELTGIAIGGRIPLSDGRVALDELQRNTLLLGPAGSSTRAVTQRQLTRIGFRASRVWELGSDDAIKQAVRADLGVGFLSRWLVRDEVDRGELVAFGIAGAGAMRRALELIRPCHHPLSPAAAAFAAVLTESVSLTMQTG